MRAIDLNCDMGESFGAWKMGRDAELMEYVSSVSLACGFHAGDPTTIRKGIDAAIKKGLAVGAHPGFPDLQGFGRRDMAMHVDEIYDIVVYQVAALKGICEAAGGRLNHVKPHGALYNQAAVDRTVAASIARAVKIIDADLLLFGFSGSFLISEAEAIGLRAVSEAFADRRYTGDGQLVPRTRPNAMIHDVNDSIDQVLQMVECQTVTVSDGNSVAVKAETICIHGDGENAVEFARELSRTLRERNVEIRAAR